MRIDRYIILTVALLQIGVSLSAAQQGRDSLSSMQYTLSIDTLRTFNIGAVTVKASRTPKEAIPVQTLSGEELQKLSSHSVADAVRYFSGVQVKDYGGVGGLKTVNVRSLGSNHVGVFFDGIEVGNAQNGVVDLGRFSLDNMEAISLYNGQKSSIFQTASDYASASTIYMATRNPRFNGEKRTNLDISLKAGSFETVNPSILWEQKLSDKISSSFSGEYLYTSGEYKFTYSKADGYDTTQMRENGDVRSFRLEGALFGQMRGGTWRTKIYYYDSERGYPGAVVRGDIINSDRQWDRNFFAQSSLRRKINNWYSIQLNAKYAHDFLHYKEGEESLLETDNSYIQQEGYLSVSNLFSIYDWWSASYAIDGEWNGLDADIDDFATPQRYSLLNAIATSVNFSRFRMQASLLNTYINDKTINSESADSRSIYTPTVVASGKPIEGCDLDLRAFYKRIFRMPTLNDLYYTDIGNRELKPEYTTQYNIGATYNHNTRSTLLQRIELQADIYYNQVEDKIIATPTTNQFQWSMLNLGYVEIRGIDAAAQGYWRVAKVDISTRLNYTYQKAQDFTDPEDDYYGGQIPYVPWHSGSFIIGGAYRDWSLNYSFIYTGERYESVDNIPENYTPAWYTSDISIGRLFTLKSCELKTTLEINNLLNQQYEVVQCYPMPGINYKIRVDIKL